MPSLDEIRRGLEAHEPATVEAGGRRAAAVAVVLRGAPERPEVLFIERAAREGDPWSGHMAFPGGRIEAVDPDPRAAAERETREEVGLDLAGVEPLGRLDDLQGHRVSGVPRLVVSAFVYHLERPPDLVTNHEVESAFWIPVRDLLDPGRRVEHPPRPAAAAFPGIVVGDPDRHVVWGLTYRFLEIFFQAIGRPLPAPL